MARTLRVWSPCARSVYVFGDAHAAYGSVSIEHWNVDGRSAVNVNVADDSVVRSSGPLRISVSGETAPSGSATVHSKVAGGSSMRRNRLVDWTSKLWLS